jgi:hypothetical protein
LGSIPLSELETPEFENDISGIEYDSGSGIEYDSGHQLFLRIPQNESAVCIIETIDGDQFYYSVSEDLIPVASINSESDIMPAINQITVIYTEN